jgi:hypothetical protein
MQCFGLDHLAHSPKLAYHSSQKIKDAIHPITFKLHRDLVYDAA